MDQASNNLFTGYYLVVYFDLLGQSSTLQAIVSLPDTESEMDGFIQSLKQTVGRVLLVRELFTRFFRTAVKPDLTAVRPEDRPEYADALSRVQPIVYGLSDATVIAVPLFGDSVKARCAAVNSVHDALAAACGVMMSLLTIEIPCRAGIEVGIATQIGEHEVYGPVLERAVHLESSVAGSLRIAVGPNVLEYLESVGQNRAENRLGMCMQDTATRCRQWIITDEDGVDILDFLGSALLDVFPDAVDPEVFRKVSQFAEEQRAANLAAGRGDRADKYAALSRYCDSRAAFWNVEGSKH